MSDSATSPSRNKALLVILTLVIGGYLVAAWFHWPQYGAERIVAGGEHVVTAAHPPYWMLAPFA
ncbi:MAG: hypothetical protein ABFC54_06945 [Thermoguttaceae bacterium]